MQQTAEEKNKQKRSRIIFVLLMLVFALPWVASVYLYKNPDKIKLGMTNYGELIEPVKFEQLDLINTNIGETRASDKWLLLATGKSDCGELCKKNLYVIRQLRRALGVERAYVQTAFLLLDAENIEILKPALDGYEKTMVFTPGEESLEKIAGLSSNQSVEDRLFIIDQNENLIMAYDADADPKGVLKDVEKLIRVMHKE